jgi:hypothetical protein
MNRFLIFAMIILPSCSAIEMIEDYSESVERKTREEKKMEKYSVNLNTILDKFILFTPDREAILCANEMEMIIEKQKHMELSDTMLENLLILCQRMIWEEQRNPKKKTSKGKAR